MIKCSHWNFGPGKFIPGTKIFSENFVPPEQIYPDQNSSESTNRGNLCVFLVVRQFGDGKNVDASSSSGFCAGVLIFFSVLLMIFFFHFHSF